MARTPTYSHNLLSPSPSFPQYSKDDKSKKRNIFSPLPNSITTTSRLTFSLLIISSIFFLFGLTSIIFSLYTIRYPKPFPFFRCGRVQDTFRTFNSIINTSTTSSSELGAGNHDRNGIIERPKFLGFVGILTGFSSADRRSSLRSTWFPSDHDSLIRLEQATGIAVRFVIGRSKDAKKMRELEDEINKYHDFMLIDNEEEYLMLPYKTLAFFKAAFQLFEADYYIKADDNIYLRPDRLATLLARDRSHSRTYIGCMKKGPVITDPKMKWYEKSGHLLGNEYFLHAYGPIYVLSAEIVASLATARNDSLRVFSNEDVTVGSWMLSMNVHHEDNRALCDPRCTPTSIAVWDVPRCSGLCNPVRRLKELHNMSMCSKSPTLPPEDR